MRYPHILFGLLIAGLLLSSVMGCTSGSSDKTEAEAILIARDAVIADGVMTLDDRDEVADDEGTVWHISFPFMAALDVLGGEPHVWVVKADGSVQKIEYTQ